MFQDNKNYSMPVANTGFKPTFLGKVMVFFALAVLCSAAGTVLTYNYFLSYFIVYPALIYVVFIIELAIILTSRLWQQHSPLNKLMFVLFAFITGVTLAPLIGVLFTSAAGVALLTKALLATGFMFVAAGVFGWTTHFELSGMRGFLIIGLIGMIVVGIIGIFIPWSNTTEMIYSGIGVLLFSGYTMYDFQKIKQYPEDRYMDAALNLYLDIFNLFLYILRLIMALNRR